MKSVCLITRRADLSRAAFRDYYETRHCILGMRYFPFTKYVRNHLTGGDEVDFDVISEFWQNDTARAGAVMSSPTGDILRHDERQFMTQNLIRPGLAEELLIAGPARIVDRTALPRQIYLLKNDGLAPDAFAERIIAQAGSLSGHRVTLDKVTTMDPARKFPYDALLSVWVDQPGAPARSMPAGVTLCGLVNTEICESTPDELKRYYGTAD